MKKLRITNYELRLLSLFFVILFISSFAFAQNGLDLSAFGAKVDIVRNNRFSQAGLSGTDTLKTTTGPNVAYDTTGNGGESTIMTHIVEEWPANGMGIAWSADSIPSSIMPDTIFVSRRWLIEAGGSYSDWVKVDTLLAVNKVIAATMSTIRYQKSLNYGTNTGSFTRVSTPGSETIQSQPAIKPYAVQIRFIAAKTAGTLSKVKTNYKLYAW